jgi:RNA-directed DNA polymerase
MMHGPEKSDLAIVATKPANKAGAPAAERGEPRAGTEGNTGHPRTPRTQSRASVSPGLDRVRHAARQRKKETFTALLHHVTVDLLRESFQALERQAAPGMDGLTWQDYEANLEANLQDLHRRVHRGSYRAKPVRRRFIPKPDGRQRPLGVTALEDKILQRAVVRVLNAIYEEDFLGFSYGFRPGRSQHHALDALSVGINAMRVNWTLDADIRSFFDQIDQAWLLRFLRHRVGDERIIRLVLKWLKAGVLDEGEWSVSDRGTPQGSGASPLLANVYLHYVFDLWAELWRRQHANGQVIIVRYADDVIVGFEHEGDARRFRDAMRERLEQFGLELHGDKTRLLEFGRYASERRQRRGLGKPETFQFLGFVFICGRSRLGRFQLQRRTRADRMRERLRAIKDQLRKHMHASIPEQGKWLKSVMTGYFAYHAVPTNMRSLQKFRHRVMVAWRRTLRRRSQKDGMNWQRMMQIADAWLPMPRVLHPWPDQRFAVTHPRWEPNA